VATIANMGLSRQLKDNMVIHYQWGCLSPASVMSFTYFYKRAFINMNCSNDIHQICLQFSTC